MRALSTSMGTKHTILISPRDNRTAVVENLGSTDSLTQATVTLDGRTVTIGDYVARFPATEFVAVESLDDAATALTAAKDRCYSLDFLLMLFDTGLSTPLKRRAAEALDKLLESEANRNYVLDILLSQPLPKDTDFKTAKLLGRENGPTQQLVCLLEETRQRAEFAFHAWLAIRDDEIVTEDDRAIVRGQLIQLGIIRRTVTEFISRHNSPHPFFEILLRARADFLLSIVGKFLTEYTTRLPEILPPPWNPIEQPIQSYAERIFHELSPEKQRACVTLFSRLVDIGDAHHSYGPRRVDIRDLSPEEQSVATTLIGARLLVSLEAAEEIAVVGWKTVEVVDQELLVHWERLHSWIKHDRPFLRWRQQLDSDVAVFHNNKERWVLRGRRLREAKQFYPARKADLSPEADALLHHYFALRHPRHVQVRRRWQVLVGCLSVICLLCFLGYVQVLHNVRTLLEMPANRLQVQFEKYSTYRWLYRSRLSHEMTDGENAQDRLRATLAMAHFFPGRPVLEAARQVLREFDYDDEIEAENLNLAMKQLYVELGPITFLSEAIQDPEDPTLATEFIVHSASARQPARVASDLHEFLMQEKDPHQKAYLQYLWCLLNGTDLTTDAAVTQELLSLYQTSDDSGVHAAAAWALRQRGEAIAELEEKLTNEPESTPEHSQDWYLSEPVISSQATQFGALEAERFTFVRIGRSDRFRPARTSQVWVSDREVSISQFRAVCPERFQSKIPLPPEPGNQADDRGPMNRVSFYDALIFCDRLSEAHGLDPYYELDETDYNWKSGSWKVSPEFPALKSATKIGYRLPTLDEWTFACRAMSDVDYSFGRNRTRSDLFAHFGKEAPAICGSLRPSRMGLSDMYGNVREWCWDPSSSRVFLCGDSFRMKFPNENRNLIEVFPSVRSDECGFRIFLTFNE